MGRWNCHCDVHTVGIRPLSKTLVIFFSAMMEKLLVTYIPVENFSQKKPKQNKFLCDSEWTHENDIIHSWTPVRSNLFGPRYIAKSLMYTVNLGITKAIIYLCSSSRIAHKNIGKKWVSKLVQGALALVFWTQLCVGNNLVNPP